MCVIPNLYGFSPLFFSFQWVMSDNFEDTILSYNHTGSGTATTILDV